ncbi:hypothetical protein EV193_109120 [Herbihabitans rhizosphaerae]|uniref:Uncharacterized protein n=1 Tax=Herbihabitans rhizosphaerae TaxID=1872711 RepID=A0A4Q7KGE8_9PSEU|nr:hypothetical protein [Herbihabitans rhizosphaerae]RZS34333.1 hypothetical protein EV193_109120 [Herbihabitans rhizosphaerae]
MAKAPATSTARRDDGLWILALVRNPVRTADSALRVTVSLVPATVEALRSIPRLVTAMERLTPAIEAAQGSLDHLDRLGTFIAEELPETQDQLEQLRGQLTTTATRIAELGPQLVAVTGVNRALNDSIKLLARGLGVVQGTTDKLSSILDRLPDVRRPKAEP